MNDITFNKLFLPIRDEALQIIKLSENRLSKAMLYYSVIDNIGVFIRKI